MTKVFFAVFAAGCSFASVLWGQCNETITQSSFPGVSMAGGGGGVVRAVVEWDPDGAGPEGTWLVIAGMFDYAGTVRSPRVAAWDGQNWRALPLPITPGLTADAHALAVYNGQLYMSGFFPTISSVLRWNGSGWEQPSAYIDGVVYTLHVHDGELFAGGTIEHAGGNLLNRAGRYDGAVWRELEASAFGASTAIRAITAAGPSVLLGGTIDTLRGQPSSDVVIWDGVSIQPVGSMEDHVHALAVFQGDVVAGGEAGTRLSRWNGVQWSPLTSPAPNQVVRSLLVRDGSLLIGGDFTAPVARFGVWDGQSIQQVQTSALVHALGTFREQLVSAGYSYEVLSPSTPARNVLVHTAQGLAPPTSGPYLVYGLNDAFLPNVWAMEPYADGVVCGGTFSAAGAALTPNVAWVSDVGWQSMGSILTQSTGWTPRVGDLHVHNGVLYAAARHVSRWNGEVWGVVGTTSGTGYGAFALESTPEGLVAAGGFASIDGVAVANVALLDSGGWRAMGNGVSGDVYALTTHQGQLVIGGEFTQSGGVPTLHVAAWGGSAWQPIGNGVVIPVYALTSWNGSLVAGGSPAGLPGEPHLRMWDGGTWSPLHGTRTPGLGSQSTYVSALTTYNSDLIVGGTFRSAGGQPATGLARWNGRAWTAINNYSGIYDGARVINGLKVIGDELWIGGWFSISAGQPNTPYFARLRDTGSCGPCDPIDFNHDTLFPDTQDVADFVSVFSGGVCAGQQPGDPPCNSDIDFNNDALFPDTSDISALLRVFAGGPCDQ